MSINEDMKENWDRWAESDPYYAVITDPANKGGANDLFWQSGINVADRANYLASLCGLDMSCMTVAELGVGVGRVGAGLMNLCKEYTGIDVSSKMLDVCRHHHPNMKLQLVTEPFPEVDLFYSVITLQHCAPSEISILLDRMFRAAKKAVLFQLTDMPYDGVAPHQDDPYMPMYGAPIIKVIEDAVRHNFSTSLVIKDTAAGPDIDSYCYLFTRKNTLTCEQP